MSDEPQWRPRQERTEPNSFPKPTEQGDHFSKNDRSGNKKSSRHSFSNKRKHTGHYEGSLSHDSRHTYRSSRSNGRDHHNSSLSKKYSRVRRSHDEKIERRRREPEIPDSVKADALELSVRKELTSLNSDNADVVARHLVMAGSYIDIDPDKAYAHAQAAVERASRIGIVRQAAALAAYSCGKYAEALREVRTVRRLMGSDELRAVEADCERGLGKPDKALEVIDQADKKKMTVDELAELVIVESGTRADMGQHEAALLVLDDFIAHHHIDNDETSLRLMEVRIDRLQELGRDDEAKELSQRLPDIPEPVTIVDLEEIVDSETPWVPSDLRGSRKALIDTCDLLVMDLDGVCYMGSQRVDHVSESLSLARYKGKKIMFVTNNASRTPQQVVNHLKNFEIFSRQEEIMTSGMDGVELLKEQLPPGAKVFVVGAPALAQLVSDAGFAVVDSADEHPAAVIQGYASTIDWKQLSEAAYAIRAGATFISTNMDATLPTERGLALGNGSLVLAVTHATGKEAIAGGKPFPGIYRRALDKAHCQRPLCIGDRLDTDIAGARAAGLRSMHVLTGVATPRDIALAPREQRPDFLGIDMQSITEPSPGPVKNPTGVWTVGDSAGFDIRNKIIFRDNESFENKKEVTVTLNDYRAMIAAIWEARDAGVYVKLPDIHVIANPHHHACDHSVDASEKKGETEVSVNNNSINADGLPE